ncbi:MAG: class I SAM-dependent methyltransferase [Methanobacteriota archaeon]|nr:MAG: class I SAM-dependent methyltransferase [Euryarchaeota archaeon]
MHSAKFDPKHMSILEDEDRNEILDVNKVIDSVSPHLGNRVADIGCGTGFFSIPISARLRPEGEVFAIDMDNAMLERLKENIVEKSGIRPIKSREKNIPNVEDSSVDSCFMVNVLHELEGNGTLREAYRILRPGGHLILVDWKKVKMDFGPPYKVRIPERDAIRRCGDVGFELEKTFYAGQYNYGLLMIKPGE